MKNITALTLCLILSALNACKSKSASDVQNTSNADAQKSSCADVKKQITDRASELKAEQANLGAQISAKDLGIVKISDVLSARNSNASPAVKVMALNEDVAMLNAVAALSCDQLLAGDSGSETQKNIALVDNSDSDLDASKPLQVVVTSRFVELLQSAPLSEGRFFGYNERRWETLASFLRNPWHVVVNQLFPAPVVLRPNARYRAYAYTSLDTWAAKLSDGSMVRPSRSYIYDFSPLDGGPAFDGYLVTYHVFLDGHQRSIRLSDLNDDPKAAHQGGMTAYLNISLDK